MPTRPPPSDLPQLDKDWCAYHNTVEPYHPEQGDRCCGECWHTFKPGELLAEHQKLMAQLDIRVPPAATEDDVWVCPLCSHDL